MTTFAELKADVLAIVKRPDLSNEVELHIKNAILKLHSADFFSRDLYENDFITAVSATQYSLDYKSLVPRWRKTKYLTIVDPNTSEIIKSLDPVSIDSIRNIYGQLKDYCWYESGNVLKIRASGGEQNFGFGCYLFPDTTLANPSWIVDEFPYAVHYEAARTLFKLIGFDEQSAAAEKLLAEAMIEVKMSGLTAVGE